MNGEGRTREQLLEELHTLYERLTERPPSGLPHETEEPLSQVKERADLLYRVVPSAIFTVDTERRITSWNDKAAEITGYSESEVVGKDCRLFAASPCNERCGLFSPTIPKPVVGGECTIQRKDGQMRFISKNADLLRDFQGKTIGGIESFEDVTERKQAYESLRESENRYRTLVEAMDDAVHVRDLSGRFIMVNPAVERRLGRTKEELLGKTAEELHNEVIARQVVAADVRVIETGSLLDAVEEYPDREVARVCHIRKLPIRTEEGKVLGVLTVSRDITERRQAEDALAKERDFTSAVIETVGNLVVVLDRRGRIVRFNRACERITGYSFGEMKDKELWDVFLAPEEVPSVRAIFQNLVAGLFPNTHENHWLTRDGGRRLIAWNNTAMVDSTGAVEYVISAGTDITDQRQAEEALMESNKELAGWVEELELRSRESRLLNEMGDLLQTCPAQEDAYSVVAHSAQRLFPGSSGGLFVTSESRNLVDAVATWGGLPDAERVFSPDECWGLRRGRAHIAEDATSGLVCHHVKDPTPGLSLCVPMVAQGNALGILHLRGIGNGADESESTPWRPSEVIQQLAVAASERVALALANLKLQATLRDQAIHDVLTGLYNRRYMEEMLEREVSRALRRGSTVGIIMLDIDHFKRFNDLFGHEAGDALLSALGGYLRAHVRGEDIACRYGGEEFTLILPDASLQATRDRAEELRDGIKQLRVEHRRLPLGSVMVSAGVAAFPQHGCGGQEVMRAADLALYRAKAEGRDRVVSAF